MVLGVLHAHQDQKHCIIPFDPMQTRTDRIAAFCATYLIGILLAEAGLFAYRIAATDLFFLGFKAIMLAWVIALALQYLIHRKRPFQKTGKKPLIKMWKETPSFPSAHAAISFATVGVMYAEGDARVAVILAVLGSIVAWSRVRVRVHYVSDVLAGAVLGLVVAAVVVRGFVW